MRFDAFHGPGLASVCGEGRGVGNFSSADATAAPTIMTNTFIVLAAPVCRLTLLWQIQFTPQSRPDPLSAVRAALKRSHDEIDDSVAHGWQAWLRWWSVDSFFPASLG
jgi:hypothetical protein